MDIIILDYLMKNFKNIYLILKILEWEMLLKVVEEEKQYLKR